MIEFEFFRDVLQCITNLNNLVQLKMDQTAFLTNIPIGTFNMHKMIEFSIHWADISYSDLLLYNNMTNDSFTFEWNKDTIKYYLTLNPICDEINSLLLSLQEFINEINCCYYPGDEDVRPYCSPSLYQNGICDFK